MAQESSETQGRKSPPSMISIASGLAAPIILIAASALYSAGSMYMETIYYFYGLPSSTLDLSIQVLMVYGYTSMLSLIAISTLLAYGLILIARSFKGYKSFHENMYNGARRPIKFYHVLMILYVIFGSLGVGWLSGRQAAKFHISTIDEKIRNHCLECYVYDTGKTNIVGIAIAQDTKSTVIATRKGVAVLPSGTIKRVYRLIPRRATKFPLWVMS